MYLAAHARERRLCRLSTDKNEQSIVRCPSVVSRTQFTLPRCNLTALNCRSISIPYVYNPNLLPAYQAKRCLIPYLSQN